MGLLGRSRSREATQVRLPNCLEWSSITVFLFLAGSVLAGFAITLLSGLRLTLEERVFFGAVIGLVVVTAATLGFFLVFGLGPVSLGLGSLVTAGLGAAGLLVGRPALAAECREFTARWTSHPKSGYNPWPLVLLLLISWIFTFHFFAQAYVLDDQGLHAGYPGIWADWGYICPTRAPSHTVTTARRNSSSIRATASVMPSRSTF